MHRRKHLRWLDFLIMVTIKPFPFSQNLFWDSDIVDIDLEKNKRYVIERIIIRGRMEDFKKLLIIYTREEIVASLKQSKELDPKSANFCGWYFNIPLQDLHVSSFYR